MKKITLTLALAFIGLTAFAQIQTEDFEAATLPDGWTNEAVGDSAFLVWEFGGAALPVGDPFTSNAAIFDDDQDSSHLGLAELTSPAVDVSSVPDLSLSYDYSLQDFAGGGDLIVSVYDGTDWVVVATYADADIAPTSETLDVSAYANAAFQVRFTFDDELDWVWGAGVDSFVLDGTLSTDDNSIAGFKMFPNPANNVLNVAAGNNIETVTIINMVGQKVLEEQVGATSSQLDIARLQTGAYLMQVTTDGQVGTYKFVKQ